MRWQRPSSVTTRWDCCFLHVLVDVQKRERDELHPELFDLMHDLELQLVAVAELIEWLLTREQCARVQVDLVVESAATLHLSEKMLAVHGERFSCRVRGPLFRPGRAIAACPRTMFVRSSRDPECRNEPRHRWEHSRRSRKPRAGPESPRSTSRPSGCFRRAPLRTASQNRRHRRRVH